MSRRLTDPNIALAMAPTGQRSGDPRDDVDELTTAQHCAMLMMMMNNQNGTWQQQQQEESQHQLPNDAKLGGGRISNSSAISSTVPGAPTQFDYSNARNVFPYKLHKMICEAERDGQEHIIGWLPGGRAFCIRDKKRLSSEVLGRYQRSNVFKTFLRNLRLWGFERTTPDSSTEPSLKAACLGYKDAFHHPMFVRDRPELCACIRRRRQTTADDEKEERIEEDENNDDDAVVATSNNIPSECTTSGGRTEMMSSTVSATNNDSESVVSSLSMQSHNISQLSFPEVLHQILSGHNSAGAVGLEWSNDGVGIKIVDEDRLRSVVSDNKFQQMLEEYGFQRIENCYRHELVVKGLPKLCRHIASPELARRFAGTPPAAHSEPIHFDLPHSLLAAVLAVGLQRPLVDQSLVPAVLADALVRISGGDVR